MFDPPKNIFDERDFSSCVETLKRVYPRHYLGDNMFVANRNMHFLEEEEFSATFKGIATGEPYLGMAWRLHILSWAIKHVKNMSGSILEFGTFRGFKMFFLMESLKETLSKREVYLFDTFEGIDPRQAKGSPIEPEEHQKAQLYTYVKNRFKNHQNVKIIKGSAPASLSQVSLEKISFLHLDMNSWQAELAVLEELWDKIEKGGVLILDDFGLYSHRAQKDHELPWLLGKGAYPLELPTGQAVVIKNA